MKHNWQEWIDRIANKDVTEQELIEFQNLLNNSPDNQREYVEALLTESALEIEHYEAGIQSQTHIPNQTIPVVSQPSKTKKNWKALALPLVASVALIFGLAYLLGKHNTESKFTGENTTIATITDTNEVADANGMQIGQLLKQGEINIPENAEIGIAMRGGARLEINGPAKLRLDSPEKIYLFSGRVKTYAPEYAHGFSIDTDEGKVIDLGTKFVTSTGGDLGTEIHVLEGLVKASAINKEDQTYMIGGQQAGALHDGNLVSIDYLSQRLHIPINPDLIDSDGDGIADEIELHYKTDAHNTDSKPNLLRIEESFAGYKSGKFADKSKFLGLGKVSNWLGKGEFLEQGLHYQNNGKNLVTSQGCIQTTGHGGEGATIIIDNNDLPAVGSIYISFLMQQPAKNEKSHFSGLLLYLDEFNEQLFLGELSSAEGYGSRLQANIKQDYFAIPHDDKPHLFVIKIDRTRQLTDIYLDPVLGNLESTAKPNQRYQTLPKFDRISVRSGNKFPVRFDEIRVGLSWESVLPVKK